MTSTHTLDDMEAAYANGTVLRAQQKLVNLAIRTALQQMADTRTEIKTDLGEESNTEAVFRSFRAEILTKAKTYSQLIAAGNNIDKIMDALTTIDNEFDRVRAYNLLAKHNEFDLSLKSSGHKELKRLHEKFKARIEDQSKTPDISDITRMTAVSSMPETLDDFAKRLQSGLERTDGCDKRKLEEWSMRDKALLSKVLKASVDGLGAEVQFLPRHQARVAARLSHHYYKIIRSFNVLQSNTSTEDKPIEGFNLNVPDPLVAGQIRLEYNALAGFLNKLTQPQSLNEEDLEQANNLFKDPAMSKLTYDDVIEGAEEGETATAHESAPKCGPALPYSKMFKTIEDLEKFKEYFAAHGEKAGLFPLEEMTSNDILNIWDMEIKMQKLLACSQLTHACYMVDAPDTMRALWLQNAVNINAIKTAKTQGIPHVILETVAKGNKENTALPIPKPQKKVKEAGHGRA